MRRAYSIVALVASSAVLTFEHEARACGGCFTPPPTTETESVITDEKMILSVSMSQTTLYDQISYSGSPSSFAWVLPIKGTVTVGLSADVLFQVVNQLTTTTVQIPPTNCPPAPACLSYGVDEGDDGSSADDDGSSGGDDGVTVTSQTQVGPYETVQLHSSDGSALNDWLASHGYQVPASTKPIIDAYVAQQFDFLALKLVPGAGVQSMQPVRVTSQGAAPTLPLHMVAVGTGPTTGITIWVVADGRWEPSNFPTFTITDSDIAWDWATSSSDYEKVRLAKEATFGGRGWQIESSLELSQYTVQQALLPNVEYSPTGGYLTGDAGTVAPDGGDESGDDSSSGDDDSGPQVDAANADLAVLFAGVAQPNVRITRMRSDVAQSALSVDMILQAATDQSELTNVHIPKTEIGEPECPIYDDECDEIGTAPRGQAQAAASASGASGSSIAGGSGCSTTPPTGTSKGTVVLVLAMLGAFAHRLRTSRRRTS